MAKVATGGNRQTVHFIVRWAGPVFILLSLCVLPWIWYLAKTYLPYPAGCPHTHIRHLTLECRERWYAVISRADLGSTWIGFDIALGCALLSTGILGIRKSRRMTTAATVTATLLFIDFWFDYNLARKNAVTEALIEGVFLELPLALFCTWLAWRTGPAKWSESTDD